MLVRDTARAPLGAGCESEFAIASETRTFRCFNTVPLRDLPESPQLPSRSQRPRAGPPRFQVFIVSSVDLSEYFVSERRRVISFFYLDRPVIPSPPCDPAALATVLYKRTFQSRISFRPFVFIVCARPSSPSSSQLRSSPSRMTLYRNHRSEESVKFEYSLTMSAFRDKTRKHAETQTLLSEQFPSPSPPRNWLNLRALIFASSRRKLHDLRDSSLRSNFVRLLAREASALRPQERNSDVWRITISQRI